MKKIIITSLAFVFLFVGTQSVFAQTSNVFNGQSGDCHPGVGIGVYPNNISRDGNGCWTSTSVTAQAGDTINVAMYYHNNTNGPLTNVSGSITKSSSGPSNYYTFTGKMYSNQGDQTIGSVSLNLTSSQTLTYSSTHLMKGSDAVLSDQDTSVVYNEGQIQVGTVGNTWSDYGEILVVFKVGNSGSGYNDNICRDYSASNYGLSLPCQHHQTNYNSCSINSFRVSYSSIEEGDSVTLYWDTDNCNSVYISDIGNVSSSGSRRIYPSYTRNYSISASGYRGSDSDSVRVYVDEDDDDDDDDYYYGGYYYNTPTASTYTPTNISDNSATLNGYASGNGSKINSWIEFPCYGKKYASKNNQSSSNISTTVYSLSPNTTYNYCMVAKNVNTSSTTRGNTISFTTSGNSYVNNVVYVNKNVVTTVATNINQTSAQLNGYITNSNYYNSANTYFEYGTDVDLGSRTGVKNTVGNSNMIDTVTGLTPNTIYYFRAVSEGNNGISRGSIEVFKTTGNTNGTTVKTVYVQGKTVVGSESPIKLSITNKYELISEGDTVDYVVTYKNIGKTKLTNPMVQVVLPTNITLTNSSRGTYAVDTHTLSAKINDLNAGEEGVIYLEAHVDSIPANNSQIATTAIFVYTGSNGAQENAMAYVMNVPKDGGSSDGNSVLGGSAFFASFISLGLIGWLIIILIILIIILLVRSYAQKHPNDTHTSTH